MRSYEHRQKHNDYSRTACSVDELSDISDSTDIETMVENRELLDKVYAVMNTMLSAEEKTIIFGSIFDGRSAKELAELLDISPENVRQKKARALRKLRDIITKGN